MRRFIGTYRSLIVVLAVIATMGGTSVMSGAPQLAARRHFFVVSIEGHDLGSWQKVSGLDVTFDVVEFREGNGPIRYFAGATRYSNIKLERAFTGGTELWDWFNAFSQTRTERVRGTIIMFDAGHTEVARWNFENAWPQKFTGPVLDSSANDVPIESLELVHEGFTRLPPPTR